MTQILVTKPGAIHADDRAKLRSEGVVIVEVDTPSDVKMLGPNGAEIGAGGLLYAAMKSLTIDHNHAVGVAQRIFAATVLSEIEAERAAKKALPRDEHGRFAKRGEA